MSLFSKIYTCLLIGIVGMLLIEANLNYEEEIRLFRATMAEKAITTGRLVAQVVSGLDPEQDAGDLLRRTGGDGAKVEGDDSMVFSLLTFEQIKSRYSNVAPQVLTLDSGKEDEVIAFDTSNSSHHGAFITLLKVPGGVEKGILQVSQPLAPLSRFAHQMLIQSLLVTAVLGAASALIVFIFIHIKIRKPLDKLSQKAIEIGKGNLVADLDIKGDDELVTLGRIMNDMCTRLLIAKEKIHFEHLSRLRTLEQLRHTEKLSTIGQISAGVAHEMGTPLNVVDGRAKMILSGSLSAEDVANCALIIKNQAEKMTRIIRQLLDFSRKKKLGPKTSENVEILLGQVIRLLEPIGASQRITLTMKVSVADQRLLVSRMDGQQMQQVFMNIILNGIQATPEGGHVQIEITSLQVKSVMHTDDQLRRLIRVEILDDGPGIDEKHLHEIFTPFFTTKQIGLGTGLGLSVAQEILEEHGGWIEVDNRPVRGARFMVFLRPEEVEQ